MLANQIIGTEKIGNLIHSKLFSSVDSQFLVITASDQVNYNFIWFRLFLDYLLDYELLDVKSLNEDDF